MIWSKLWMSLFGSTSFCGIDMGFWVAMSVVLLIVILMNAVFWGMHPKKSGEQDRPAPFPEDSLPGSGGQHPAAPL